MPLRPVEQALHVPNPFGYCRSPAQQAVDQLGTARPVAMAVLGVRYLQLPSQPAGGRSNDHKSPLCGLRTNIAFLAKNLLAVFFILEGPGIGMQSERVVSMRTK